MTAAAWQCPKCMSYGTCYLAGDLCPRREADERQRRSDEAWNAAAETMVGIINEAIFDPMVALANAMVAGVMCAALVRSGAADELEYFGGDL